MVYELKTYLFQKAKLLRFCMLTWEFLRDCDYSRSRKLIYIICLNKTLNSINVFIVIQLRIFYFFSLPMVLYN